MDKKSMSFGLFTDIFNKGVYQKKKALSLVSFLFINTIVLIIALMRNFTIWGLIGSLIVELLFFISKTYNHNTWSYFSEIICQLLFVDTIALLIINWNILFTSEPAFDLSTASYNIAVWMLLLLVGAAVLFFNKGSNLLASWGSYCALYVGLAYLCLYENDGWPPYIIYYYLFFFLANSIWHFFGFVSVSCKNLSFSDEKGKHKRLEFHYLSIILFCILATLFVTNRFVLSDWVYSFPVVAIDIINNYALFLCIAICVTALLYIIFSYYLIFSRLGNSDKNIEELNQVANRFDEITLVFVAFTSIAIRVAFEWYFPFECVLFIVGAIAFAMTISSESGANKSIITFNDNLIWLIIILAIIVFSWIDFSKGRIVFALYYLSSIPILIYVVGKHILNLRKMGIVLFIWTGVGFILKCMYDWSSISNYVMISILTGFIVIAFIALLLKRPDNMELNNNYFVILGVVFVLLFSHANDKHGIEAEMVYNDTQTKIMFDITAKGNNNTIQGIDYARRAYQWDDDIDFKSLEIEPNISQRRKFKIKSNCLELKIYDSKDETILLRRYYPYTFLNPEKSIIYNFIASF